MGGELVRQFQLSGYVAGAVGCCLGASGYLVREACAAALLGRPIQAKAELQRSGMTGGRDRLDDVIARSGPLGDRLTLK